MGKRCFWPLASLALLLALSLQHTATASVPASAQVLTISPTSQNLTIQPGGATTGSFQVINQGKTTYSFNVYTEPYHVSGESYTPEFTPVKGAPDVVSWFQVSLQKNSIGPNDSSDVDYSIHVPAGTPAGGYYAVIFAQTQLPQKSSLTLNERVGELFYLQVAGPLREQGSVASWQASLLQKQPLTATLRLEDNSSLHYISHTVFTVKDLFGHVKYQQVSDKVVLPQTIRRMQPNWPETPPFGLFKVGGSVTIFGNTTQLPDRYVLVMSPAIQFSLAILLGLLVGGVVVRSKTRRQVHGKRPKSST